MKGLLAFSDGYPRRRLECDDVLLVDGQPAQALYVLLDGGLRIEKSGVPITTVTQPGSCVGEMSLLLGIPATADVIANQSSELAVIEGAATLLEREGGQALALSLARLLAERLQAMTTYLADLKNQYADHEGGLGMVDVVLDTLMQGPGVRSELGSERDPEPEY